MSVFRFLILATLGALALSSPAASATDATATDALQPFSVVLTVTYRGIRAGKSELSLQPLSEDRWRYRSTNRARGLFRLVFPDDIEQYSELRLGAQGITPLRYVADDGSEDTARDITLNFDWDQRKVFGIAEDEPVQINLGPEDPQDPMSVQLALMWSLQAGHTPDHFWLADKRQLKRYLYRAEGRETLTVAGESLQTVIWSSHREGSDRVTRVWYAKDLGWIPLRAERVRGERVEWTMQAERYSLEPREIAD